MERSALSSGNWEWATGKSELDPSGRGLDLTRRLQTQQGSLWSCGVLKPAGGFSKLPDAIWALDCLLCFLIWFFHLAWLCCTTTAQQFICRASWKTFCVIQSGITNNTHVEFVKMIKSHGHTEVMDPEECDYCLLFCPITSKVGTDVALALRKIPANKPTILVVMYHTLNSNHVVPDSRRLTEDTRVKLAVSCLFYEQNLLNSNCNDTAKDEIRKLLGFPENSRSYRRSPSIIRKCDRKHLIFLGVGLVVFFIVLLIILMNIN